MFGGRKRKAKAVKGLVENSSTAPCGCKSGEKAQMKRICRQLKQSMRR